MDEIKWLVQFYKETPTSFETENIFLFFFLFDELINGFQYYTLAIEFKKPVEFSIHNIFVLSLRRTNIIFLL